MYSSRMKCHTCGLNPPYTSEPPLEYDPGVECEGCNVREGNIISLLDGILKLAKHKGIVQKDLALEEFTGIHALQILEDMSKETD